MPVLTDTELHEHRERLQKIVQRFENVWPHSAPANVVSYPNTLIALMMVEDRLGGARMVGEGGPGANSGNAADDSLPASETGREWPRS